MLILLRGVVLQPLNRLPFYALLLSNSAKDINSLDPIRVTIYKSRNNSKGLNCYLIGVRIESLAKRTD